MTKGLLVNPDLSFREVDFDGDFPSALPWEKSASMDIVVEEQKYLAFYEAESIENGNPLASMWRNETATSSSVFLEDPTSAIRGPIIFFDEGGEDITPEQIDGIKAGIRAVEVNVDDHPAEFLLWENAVANLRNLRK